MQLVVLFCLMASAFAARLENTYLPPSNAPGAGGSGGFLNAPFRAGGSPFGGANQQKQFGSNTAGQQIGIIRYDNNNDGLGSYEYAYETQNHISAQESGRLQNAGSENEATAVHGSYSYTGPDGVTITVNYVADENGFQPTGDHLPTPPPIPEAILKSLEYNAANDIASNRYQSGDAEQFQTSSPSRQYLTPNKASFNQNSGYRY